MNIIGVIPARMAAKRLPNKPMELIHGIPMIGHVYQRSKLCQDFSEVYVATCDSEIMDYINKIGGKTILTAESHVGAIDRVAEAVDLIEKQDDIIYDTVALIQGDEPMVTPNMIACAISPLMMEPDIQITSLMSEITSDDIFEDQNEVKVVVDINNYAMYFSREPIPSKRKGAIGYPRLKLVGITVFRRDFLTEFNTMFQTPLEVVESIDLIRIIENGMKIKMVMTEQVTYSVDTSQELEKIKELMNDDYLIHKYQDICKL